MTPCFKQFCSLSIISKAKEAIITGDPACNKECNNCPTLHQQQQLCVFVQIFNFLFSDVYKFYCCYSNSSEVMNKFRLIPLLCKTGQAAASSSSPSSSSNGSSPPLLRLLTNQPYKPVNKLSLTTQTNSQASPTQVI